MGGMADAWGQEHRARQDERSCRKLMALGKPARLC